MDHQATTETTPPDTRTAGRSRGGRSAWGLGVWAVVVIAVLVWALPRGREASIPAGAPAEQRPPGLTASGADGARGASGAVMPEEPVLVTALASRGYAAMNQQASDPAALDRALAEFTRAHELDPQHFTARFGLAWARQLKGRPESEWRPLYLETVATASQLAYFSHLNLAVADREAGRFREEAAQLEQATRVAPERVGGWTRLGIAYEQVDERQLAVEAFRRATEVDAGSARGFYLLGRANNQLGRSARAEAAWSRAIALDPELKDKIAADRAAAPRNETAPSGDR